MLQYIAHRQAKAAYPAAMAFLAELQQATEERARRHLTSGERRELEAIQQQEAADGQDD